MQKVQEYREYARRCELLLAKAQDLRVRQQLRRERQEWLELAASREASIRGERWAGERPLDQEMTLSSLRAFEAGQRAIRRRSPPHLRARDGEASTDAERR